MKIILRLLRWMIILNTTLIVVIFSMSVMNRMAGMSQLSDLGTMTLQSFRALRPIMWTQQGMNSPMLQAFIEQLSEQSTMLNMFMYTTDGELIYAYKEPSPELITNDYQPRMVHGDRLVLYDKFVSAYGHGMGGHRMGMMGHGRGYAGGDEVISCIVLDASQVVSNNRMDLLGLILALITETVMVLIYLRCRRQLIAFEESEKRLRVVEQEATTGRLAAILAHEIKNPLSSMKGLISYALKKTQDEKSTESLEKSIDEVDRLSGIVNSFLAFGRPMDLQYEKISVCSVVGKALQLLSYDVKDRDISIVNTGGDFEISADTDKLLQVFVNLLMNALDAAPAGTEIRIDADSEALTLRIANEVRDPNAVKDGRWFEPFFTTKAKGSGLGLAISKKIMTMHGFDIAIEKTDPFTVVMRFN